ncbi:F-box only protein 25 [Sitodiplosis mosellana]|uniref:F-box only protein 25 n=1 Tax=Sitodiplosis mosellana TaxID=263140 RepID=UPI00244470DD|nr:F-box only protein 25 [Sitodiplosis mosellana]
MPFISKDWRSPGEAWVKTDDGWEKLKVLECGKRKRCSSEPCDTSESWSNPSNGLGDDDSETDIPPHCHITLRCTREIAGFNGLGEAVKRLDFRSSVRDRRRFQYVCSLLRLLVSNKGIASLPGSAQRMLLQMLEEVATHVSDSQQNINVLRGLAIQLQKIVNQENQKCWGKPLGSEILWKGHVETIQRIQEMATQIKIKEPGPDVYPKLQDLPEECVREIILRINDHRDLEASSAAWTLMAALASEQRVWRELTQFHFTKPQIDQMIQKQFANNNDSNKVSNDRNNSSTTNSNSQQNAANSSNQRNDVNSNSVNSTENKTSKRFQTKDWQKIYHALRRKYGIREDYQYSEILALCRFCCCLFWPSAGHPCIADQSPDYRARLKEAAGGDTAINEFQPVPPAQFLKYFSL